MLVVGDIKCLHCGHPRGRWVGPSGSPLTASGLRAPGGTTEAGGDAVLHCLRCGGPLFLEDASPVSSSTRIRRIRRLREQIAALDGKRAA